MIDGGAKFARTLRVPANEGGTHGSMSACVATDGRLRTPINAGFRENLTRRSLASNRIGRRDTASGVTRTRYPRGYGIPPAQNSVCLTEVAPSELGGRHSSLERAAEGVRVRPSTPVLLLHDGVRDAWPVFLASARRDDGTAHPPAVMTDAERQSRRILDTLSDDERVVCSWKALRFSNRDIAQLLGWSVGRVERTFATAQEKIVEGHLSKAIREVDR
jgi:hypothetical protein